MEKKALKQQTLNEIQRLLEGINRVLIVSHVDPDGDTIGSALGLAWALRRRGLDVSLACQDPVPSEAAFLPGSEAFRSTGPVDEDLVIAVDASDLRRLGMIYSPERFAGRPLLVIDHHMTNTSFGDVNLIEDVAATVQIILKVIDHLQVPLDARIATCLLTGLVTDTQGFRTSSTTAEAFSVAQRLAEAGASLTEITDQVFNRRPFRMLSLWGAALTHTQLIHGIVWTELPLDLVERTDTDGEASSGLVNYLNTVQEGQVAVVFREQGDGIVDVSFRSKPGVDVSGIAVAFGGGGHPQAAGCQVQGRLSEVRERILTALQPVVAKSLART